MTDKTAWDMRLRQIVSDWWDVVLRLSPLSRAEIIRRSGYKPSSFHRMERREVTPRGAFVEAIATVTGLPRPDLRDALDYGELAKKRFNAGLSANVDAQDVQRIAQKTAQRRGVGRKKEVRQGARGKS